MCCFLQERQEALQAQREAARATMTSRLKSLVRKVREWEGVFASTQEGARRPDSRVPLPPARVVVSVLSCSSVRLSWSSGGEALVPAGAASGACEWSWGWGGVESGGAGGEWSGGWEVESGGAGC
jgi:hypothetical protein